MHYRSNSLPVTEPSTVENIQALRGIAALMVVWAHLKFPLVTLWPESQNWPVFKTMHGAIGVDLFFIISGYVICLTACKRHHHPVDFFLSRIARVTPIYLLVTVVAIVGKQFFQPVHPTLISVWNGVFYLPIFDVGDYTAPALGVGWTLSFEMWFYTVFALLLNLWKPKRVAMMLPVLFLAGAVVMMLYHGYWYFPRFMFHPFVLEFAMGCVVYHTQNWVGGWAPYILVFMGVFAMVAFTRRTGDLGWHPELLSHHLDLAWLRVALWGGPWALVTAGLVGLERNQGIVLPRALTWVGGISYSLYLTHRFALAVIGKAATLAGLHNLVASCAVLIAGSILFAWQFWTWLEKPLTKRAQRWAKKVATSRTVSVVPSESSA